MCELKSAGEIAIMVLYVNNVTVLYLRCNIEYTIYFKLHSAIELTQVRAYVTDAMTFYGIC